MKYIKTIRVRNVTVHLITSSPFLANLASNQLNFPKFKTNYKKYITVFLILEEINHFPYGRSDRFNTNKNDLSSECWLKNIDVNAYPYKNFIVSKILMPTTLPSEAILDLLIIHPIRHILKYKNIFLVHAAVLEKNNKGILICGAFKSGKSTLAIKLVEDGFKFLSDEFVVFDKGRLFSFPLKIGLERNSLKMFPKLRKLAKYAKKSDEKVSFDIRDFYPNCFSESCLPDIIIFPTAQRKSKKVTIKPINKKTAFSLLCKDKDNSLPFEKNLKLRQKQIQILASLAQKSKSYYLSYSLDKIDEASKTINKLISSPT